ncbi:hypothetical protein CASFOL_001138 [Castilleja foliolosa]|uniref:KIB1-4 beta-propeller domain-containing protein n=1 Tax=Castilleja foliolosa TaxID=1961234 RepID=A0ABD3ELQ3_9LAMI
MMMSTGVNSSPPWLMLPPVFEKGGDMVYKFYNLSEDKEESFPKNRSNSEEAIADDDAKFVGSSHGWLALFNQRNHNHLFLYNPITNRHIKLPRSPYQFGRGLVHKLILFSSPDDDDKCIAMMIFSPERRLASCHPCHSIKWTPFANIIIILASDEGWFPRSYLDIVYASKRKLFICYPLEGDLVECWDLTDSMSPRINSSCELNFRKLPGEYNQLFLVARYIMERMGPKRSGVDTYYYGKNRGWDNSFPYKTLYFGASKVEFGDEKPQCLEGSLDGLMAMFIGLNYSFAMSVTPETKLSANCIYYTDSNRNLIPKIRSMVAMILAFLIIQMGLFLLAMIFHYKHKKDNASTFVVHLHVIISFLKN